jgi:hypothetical protein
MILTFSYRFRLAYLSTAKFFTAEARRTQRLRRENIYPVFYFLCAIYSLRVLCVSAIGGQVCG